MGLRALPGVHRFEAPILPPHLLTPLLPACSEGQPCAQRVLRAAAYPWGHPGPTPQTARPGLGGPLLLGCTEGGGSRGFWPRSCGAARSPGAWPRTSRRGLLSYQSRPVSLIHRRPLPSGLCIPKGFSVHTGSLTAPSPHSSPGIGYYTTWAVSFPLLRLLFAQNKFQTPCRDPQGHTRTGPCRPSQTHLHPLPCSVHTRRGLGPLP